MLGSSKSIKVWDPLVRLVHWSLVADVTVAWSTDEGSPWVHEAAGYVALGLVGLRLVWGFAGSAYARFTAFVRGIRPTLSYARLVLRGREPHHIGHNPLGAWMIVALLLTVAATSLTGWLYTTDAYWGVAWVERLHGLLANLLLALVGLHVAGVVFTSWRQHENLVAAMVHGRKRSQLGDECDR